MPSVGYKVSGQKMGSRFGLSHRQGRAISKEMAPANNAQYGAPKPYAAMKRRHAKVCKHPRLRDEGYGNPETGCIDLFCPDCGYHYHQVLY